ncbi:MAG: hypothetical protein HEQ38_04130 [Gemmatimonas sp.]|nr:hypothetical protein [Gemmatimonas sp.]
MNHQLAQKIHGRTQPPTKGRRNERAKDLVDVLLIEEFLGEMAELRRTCVSVFEARGTHKWPPTLEVHGHWRDEFGRLAAEYGLHVGSLEEGATKARELIARIDGSAW